MVFDTRSEQQKDQGEIAVERELISISMLRTVVGGTCCTVAIDNRDIDLMTEELDRRVKAEAPSTKIQKFDYRNTSAADIEAQIKSIFPTRDPTLKKNDPDTLSVVICPHDDQESTRLDALSGLTKWGRVLIVFGTPYEFDNLPSSVQRVVGEYTNKHYKITNP